ncbi:hypothetical protein [Marinobacter subterrani]|uniref:hypothetical protein n=1 Tax=Marinobacter subterrani TaxID=1658765 RepID=UPI0023546A66|nr:hypothetical protein [Marinobacter subterrani]
MANSVQTISPVVARAMAKRVLQSMDQLQGIRQLGVPPQRMAQLTELEDNSRLYLVFLEEVAGNRKERSRNGAIPLLEDIQAHCQLVQRAWKQLKF